MTLQSNGSISFKQIATEFNISGSVKMSQLYRGGAHVPNSSKNTNVPTGGAIKLSNFYGAANYVPMSLSAPGINIISYQANGALRTLQGGSTCTVASGTGTGPFNYNWTYDAGNSSNPAIANTSGLNTASATFSVHIGGNGEVQNDWICTVTDSTGATAAVEISVQFTTSNNQ